MRGISEFLNEYDANSFLCKGFVFLTSNGKLAVEILEDSGVKLDVFD
jgi:hypothetical protein|tara:strand:+ start:3661 stop:3801 length:141 start_codon:yes stop_codon:yes gene_type:complete